MITKKIPDNWRDLQSKVAEILERCGFKVEIEKRIITVRGTVEIDVYAEEIINGRKNVIICECKNWKQNIPQNVIHGFRTIASDIGCNTGYIITTSDFQSGSKKANEFTNIELLTWEEFQNFFFESWYSNYFYEKLRSIIEFDLDSLKVQFFEDFHLIERDFFRKNIDKYHIIRDVVHHFPSPLFKGFPNMNFDINNKLPLRNKIESDVYEEWEMFGYDMPEDLLNEKYCEEFWYELNNYAKPIFKNLCNLDLRFDDNDND
jgi:hypothetical protein